MHHFHTMVGHKATRENRRGSENRCVNQTKVDVLSAAIVRSTMIYVLMTAVLWSLDGSKANVSRELDRRFRSACCHIHFTDSDEIAGKEGQFHCPVSRSLIAAISRGPGVQAHHHDSADGPS